MGKAGYKRFKKQEKAKVKLKGNKTILPKGQNVTDTNFKVKKIIVKEQLKEHGENELLTKKHLSIKELISRLSHHNSGMRQEALAGLRELIVTHGSDVILPSLSPLLQAVMGLTVDKESDVRTDTIKLLAAVFTRVEEDELAPLYPSVVCHLTCAMTHIEPAVRNDSLLLLDTMLATLPRLTANHTQALLPHFLDLISHRGGDTGTRALSLHLEGKVTSDKWRGKVIGRLNKLFTVISEHSVGSKKEKKQSVKWPYDRPLYVGLYDPISQNNNSNLEEAALSLPIKDYTTLLMPLLLDTFIEAVPKQDLEDPETGCVIGPDSLAILQTIVEVVLHLWNLLKLSSLDENLSDWFVKTWGSSVVTRMLVGRFPYALSAGNRKRQRNASHVLSALQVTKEQSCLLLNLRLCLLTFLLSKPGDLWTRCIGFIKRSLRGGSSLQSDEKDVLCQCLEATSESCDSTLLGVLSNCGILSDPDNTRAADFLTRTALRFTHPLHSDKHFTTWLDSLPGLLCRPSVPLSAVVNVANIARCKHPALVNSLDGWIEEILANLPSIKVTGDKNGDGKKMIANLLYWVTDFDELIVKTLRELIEGEKLSREVTNHLANIVLLKTENIEDDSEKRMFGEILCKV
ncbi:testis-expressed protein 10-like isoform X2 [Macrosteles quadrilineatus]|uniref:testis-expressed protein 10-like isoform X2 n=1 Tax=Macrosteles quadrilineatus TaxID=74068 RepID=UPI0023E1E47D|nr:testis-expressed protein 10-like isoform X2 [Macrosteles quadrilineatus]